MKITALVTFPLLCLCVFSLPEDAVAARYRQSSAQVVDLSKSRIIAYYGNFFSKRMGVLGEYPPDVMLSMLRKEIRKWTATDPSTPVIPAIEYIAIVAQKDPGADGRYRAVMPDKEIQKAIALADEIGGIVILDVQVGLSNLQAEIPKLEKFLRLPNVMLAIDPEFSMHSGAKPGTRIGSVDASEINYASAYLQQLVDKYNLPPKVLIVHRFTKPMVKNYKQIKLRPEVQIVMDMDGFGSPSLKKDSYRYFIAAEPVQYTGFKLFYKNDTWGNSPGLMTPEQVMNLKPVPKFIMYQ